MSGYRGRLIWPTLARLARLDPVATDNTDPDGAGPKTSGWSDIFAEPEQIIPATQTFGSPRGALATKYKALVDIPCQVEDDTLDELQAFAAGQNLNRRLFLTFHFDALEAEGLVLANGDADIRVNDKLVALVDFNTGETIEEVLDPPGLYVTQVRPASYGLDSLRRNLLIVEFEERQTGTPRATA